MKTINLSGSVYRYEYLAVPKYFFQQDGLNKNKSYQFYNRNVTVEYVYDVNIEIARNISIEEKNQLQKALHSVILCYADRAGDGLFLYDKMIHSNMGIVNFMRGGEVKFDYFAKRYVLGTPKDIAFATDYETLIGAKEEVKDLI